VSPNAKLIAAVILQAMAGWFYSFKSPAIAEDTASYSCLRLVKLQAIARYIPLYLYLASAIAVLEVIR
jgi:hypothetical protein